MQTMKLYQKLNLTKHPKPEDFYFGGLSRPKSHWRARHPIIFVSGLNIRSIIFFCVGLLFCLAFLFTSCAKKNDKTLAKHYHKLAYVELTDGESTEKSFKKAIAFVDKALSIAETSKFYALKATLLFKLGQLDESKKNFKKALQLCKNKKIKPEILNNYACLLAQMGNTVKANQIWKELESDVCYLTPEVAMVNQGKVMLQKNDPGQAKIVFSRAVETTPDFLDAHYYLALSAYESKDFSLAKNEVSTVLMIEPDHFGAKDLAEKLKSSGLTKSIA